MWLFQKLSLSPILYYGSLILCLNLCPAYKEMNDAATKRNYGTGLGILLAFLISGHYFYHSVFMTLGNIVIIKLCDRRYFHKVSLAYTWLYLMYVHHYVKDEYIIWMYQTQALKLVGVAFEIYEGGVEPEPGTAGTSSTAEDTALQEPSAVDIVSYTFFFVGLHKGPYYTMKVFQEQFSSSVTEEMDCWTITEQKLMKATACGFIYLILRMKYSEETFKDPKFFHSNGADFLFLYNIPLLLMYLLQYQVVMTMCTSVFTETGFGVYPAKCLVLPGYGPSGRQSLVAKSPNVVHISNYNTSLFKCYQNEKLLIGPKMQDTLKSWDMPSRYFFWAYVYKGLIRSNKEVRSALSFLAWSVWSGPTIPKAIISITLWIYVHLEAEYTILYPPSAAMKIPWEIGFSIMRLFCLLYLTPCLVMQDTNTVLKYYNSIFWVYHIVLFVLMIAAVVIFRLRQ